MSRLDDLITELCPDGVEYKKLSDISEFRRGSFPQPYGNLDWYDGSEAMPFVQVVDVAKNFLLVSKTKKMISKKAQSHSVFVKKNTVVVTLQGTIGRVAVTQYDSYVDRTLAIFEKLAENINQKFFAYQLKNKFDLEKEYARGSTIKTITVKEFADFQIPVPPLPVQEEIVRVLDRFTELEAELEAELKARTKQYEYYRDELLTFGDEVEWKELGEVVEFKRGIRVTKSQLGESGEYPVYQNSMKPLGYFDNYNSKSDTTFIICAGSAGEIGYSYQDFWAADDCYCVNPSEIMMSKYIYYVMLANQNYIKSKVRKASIPRIGKKDLETIKIPIPPLEEQARIVEILDRFDTLTNDITTGLPAEIAARRKQYEYYRDQLLTFQEKKEDIHGETTSHR